MIVDKLSNIDLYTNIPDNIKEFIKNIDKDIELGRYELDNGAYDNVEQYLTKSVSEGKFESHKKYIDIQLLLSGSEKIYYNYDINLPQLEPYNENKDITFYETEVSKSDYVTLDGTNFMLIFPHELHAPQIMAKTQQKVKKVVVKLPL